MKESTVNRYTQFRFHNRAFTLIEILAVVLIMGILLSVVAPSMIGALNSTRLTQSGDEIFGLLNQAQQISSTKGRPIEVRFYRTAGTPGELDDSGEVNGYKGMIILTHYSIGEPNPENLASPLAAPLSVAELGGVTSLPSSFLIHEGLSTLVTDAPTTGTGSGGVKVRGSTGLTELSIPVGWTEYASFLCLPEGTNLNPGAGEKWFITLVEARDVTASAGALKNFYCIQVDPVTGRLSNYRP